ncbi:MAG: hypothetical protein K8823_1070 [Cenarchaeum symbiont of Oopsacas minuta]|nr:hypothetical protein [Cenarchaeum symbiont of Oopsacas minuta]
MIISYMEWSEITIRVKEKPTTKEVASLKECFESMPLVEILAGLKFAKNRWDAKDSGTLRPGRKSIVKKEVHSVTKEQAAWRLRNWKLMIANYRRRGYSYPTIMRIKNMLKTTSSD